MADNQSNAPEQDSNDVNNPNPVAAEPSYAEVMAALESGDSAALDRLMAVQKEEEEEEEQSNPDGENKEGNQPEPVEGQGSQEHNADPNGAAPNAAPNAQPTQNNQPNQEDELRRELHRVKSELGRVGAMQRKMQQLEDELRAVRARASDPNAGQNTGNPNQPAKPELPEKIKTRIEQLRAVDPDLADTLQDMYEATAQRDDHTREDVMRTIEERQQQEEAERFYLEQKAILTEIVPQHEQVFAMPEWKEWKDTLLPNQRAMAESGYALEAAQALQAYAYWYKGKYGNVEQPSPTSSEGGDPNNANANVGTNPTPNHVVEQRNRRIEASAGVRNVPAKPQENFDPEAYFHEQYTKLGKAQGIIK